MASDFLTTQWSLLIKIKSEDEEEAAEALDTLCQNYWLPLYAWLRRSGNSEIESQDLTQGFFAHAIERDLFERADSDKGKLRTFLLVCLKRYLADVKKRNFAKKRSPGMHSVSLSFVDANKAEIGIERDLKAPGASPSDIYEYRWARTLINSAIERLKQEHRAKGKEDLYLALAPLLIDFESGSGYAKAAKAVKASEGSVKIAFHRFKIRFRKIVREEVAKTLLPGDTIEDEMKALSHILTRIECAGQSLEKA